MSTFKPTGSKTYSYDFQLNGRRFFGSTGKTEKRAAQEVERQRRKAAAAEVERDAATMAQLKGHAPLTIDVAAGRYWTEVGEFHAGAGTTWTDLARLVARGVGLGGLSDKCGQDGIGKAQPPGAQHGRPVAGGRAAGGPVLG